MKQLLFIIAFAIISASGWSQAYKDRRLMRNVEDARDLLLKTNPDLDSFFNNSAGYVLFPNVGKGGFVVGGASGRGILYEKQKAIGVADLKQLSIGFQAGGQSIIEIIFFETEEDLKNFKFSEFQFSAEASAVALKSGIALAAKYTDGVAVFALPKAGLMAGAAVGGQRFSFKPF
jgi:lipid-binding SYLF domain-containing protein